MHMADALVSPAVAVTMYAASAAAAGVSLVQLHKEEAAAPELAKKKLPTMAVMSALVFAGQMINYTIPGTGSSGHLCGGMLLSAILGPWAGFLSMIVILAIQALFFADGGLLALGANVWNMAFYGCFVGYFLIYRPLMQGKLLSGKGRTKLVLASILGCVVTLQLGALSVVVETSLSGITALPFGAFAALMQPIHLAIGLVEGGITAAVLLFVYQTRPELLQCASASGAKNRCSRRATLAILAAAALVIGGGLSLLASSNPDGLEWSLFGDEEAGGTEDVSVWEFGVLSGADVRKKLRAGTHIVNHPRYLRLLCRLAETAPITVVDNSRFQSIDYYRRYATPLGVSAAAIDEADRLSSRIARVGWGNVKGASACDFAAFLHSIGVKIGAVVFDGRAYHVHNDSLLRELSGETEVSFDMADTPKNGAVTLDFSVYRDEISERKGLDRLLFMLKRAGELCHL